MRYIPQSRILTYACVTISANLKLTPVKFAGGFTDKASLFAWSVSSHRLWQLFSMDSNFILYSFLFSLSLFLSFPIPKKIYSHPGELFVSNFWSNSLQQQETQEAWKTLVPFFFPTHPFQIKWNAFRGISFLHFDVDGQSSNENYEGTFTIISRKLCRIWFPLDCMCDI